MENMSENHKILNAIKTSGKSRIIEDWPILETYMTDTGEYPIVKSYVDAPISHGDMMEELDKLNAEQIFSKEEIDCNMNSIQNTYGFYRLSKGYYLELSSNIHIIDDYDKSCHPQLKKYSTSEIFVFVTNIIMYAPRHSSSLYDKELEDKIFKIVKSRKLERNATTPSIGMICQEDGEFYIKDFYIKTEYEIVEGDLHYGKGFTNFHNQLMNRFKKDTKGLVLFHGEPGTGKTFYIRSLMKELTKLNKFIVYLPPNVMNFMISPEMVSYISNIIMEKSEEGMSCILLLEDAEPLLESRSTGGRSDGITNLLNITDGLLNDMLGVQVIATFNTHLKNIDDALLRPERLIARKEFKKLTKEDSASLIAYLKIDKKPGEYTLAEIYSNQKSNEILIHEYNNITKKIGFGN